MTVHALPVELVDLGTATDLLNEALGDAEDAIDALRLGVTVSVPIGVADHALVWKKSGADWGLFVHNDVHNQASPVLATSRKLRVAAAMKLPELHAAMLKAVEEQEEGTKFAVQVVRSFIASLPSRRVSEDGGT
jgi:hypothetical protein